MSEDSKRPTVVNFTKPEECVGVEIIRGYVVDECSYDAETGMVRMTVSLSEEKKSRPQFVMKFE